MSEIMTDAAGVIPAVLVSKSDTDASNAATDKYDALMASVRELADEFDTHSERFIAERDLPVRQDWEYVTAALRALVDGKSE